MASSFTLTTEVIGCGICGMPSQQFCNNCQICVCVDCIKNHEDVFSSLSHDIVPFKERSLQLIFLECEFHPGQHCETNCETCNLAVCIKCTQSGAHQGHNVVELYKVVGAKKQEIKKQTDEIESKIIPKYQATKIDIESKIFKVTNECDRTENERERLRKIWHQEVDIIFNKVGSFTQFIKDYNLAALTTQQTNIEKELQEILLKVEQNKVILNSKLPYEVVNYQSTVKEPTEISNDFNIRLPCLKSNAVSDTELSIKMGEIQATMTQTSQTCLANGLTFLSTKELLSKSKVVASISTKYKPLFRVACVGTNEAFITGKGKTISRIDIRGSVLDTFTTECQTRPSGMSVIEQGELFYSDCDRRTLNIVRHGQAKIFITLPQGWDPYSLCCCKSGDILVHVSCGGKNRIIRYKGINLSQDIDLDQHGNPIFKEGKFTLNMVENNNGDVCVSDVNADSVVDIDTAGKVRFRYDGTAAKRKKPFSPRCIVTDSLSQIIVTDVNNFCIHILDQDGKFLKCLINSGVKVPCGLSVDCYGRLWVGLLEKGKIKVLEYLKKM